jgi:hypothetical protein
LPRTTISTYAESFALPFARRLDSTLRPLLVAILLRKPCTFERWRFFGWYVLSTIKFPLMLFVKRFFHFGHDTTRPQSGFSLYNNKSSNVNTIFQKSKTRA